MGLAQPFGIAWLVVAVLGYAVYLIVLVVYRLYFSPLAKFPGPKLAAFTSWYEFYHDVIRHGKYTFEIADMHKVYGAGVVKFGGGYANTNFQDRSFGSHHGSFMLMTQTSTKSSTRETAPATNISSMRICLATQKR